MPIPALAPLERALEVVLEGLEIGLEGEEGEVIAAPIVSEIAVVAADETVEAAEAALALSLSRLMILVLLDAQWTWITSA